MRPSRLAARAVLLCALVPGALRAQCPDAAPLPAGPSAYVAGIDVSHYQGAVPWAQLPAQGVRFAYVKATEGTQTVDPAFAANWQGAREAGVLRGAYHFFHPEYPAEAQAQHFLSTVGALGPLDLPAALDLEVSDKVSADTLAARALRWLQQVEAATGKRPVVYTDPWFGSTYLASPQLRRYPLWIADYSAEPATLPGAWNGQQWAFWQHSQSGRVQGISGSVDLDTCRGSLEGLQRFACTGELPS